MTCAWCLDDALALLLDFGFTERQAIALITSRETVFLVPLAAT